MPIAGRLKKGGPVLPVGSQYLITLDAEVGNKFLDNRIYAARVAIRTTDGQETTFHTRIAIFPETRSPVGERIPRTFAVLIDGTVPLNSIDSVTISNAAMTSESPSTFLSAKSPSGDH